MERALGGGLVRRLFVKFEAWSPTFAALAAVLFYVLIGPSFFLHSKGSSWQPTEIYSFVFDVFSILTGIMFAVYSIVATSENDFMRALRVNKAPAYALFRSELKSTIIACAGVTIGSLPYLVVGPAPLERLTGESLAVAVWCGCVAASAVKFWRVASTFFVLVDRPPTRGFGA